MFFFAPLVMAPAFYLMALYVLAAVVPALLLMRYVYRQDQIERESPWLLGSLVWKGVLAALVAIVLESLGQLVLDATVDGEDPKYVWLLAFLVVAAVEEGTKFFFLYRRTWREPEFNFRFDAIVYAVFVSLGFAAYENITYVLRYGLSVALPRALLAVPGHAAFAVVMGAFYGRARLREGWGDLREARRDLWTGYLFAVFLHGFYDTCAMIGTGTSTVVFLVFVALMFLGIFRLVKKESATDAPV